jgi:integrase
VLGEYPALSLAKARDAAEDARTAIRNGRDPVGERQVAQQEAAETVSALIAEYVAKHVRVKQRGRVEEERILKVEVQPRWKDRSVRDITRGDVRSLIQPIADRGSPIMANRVLAVIRRLMNYGVRHEWINGNPAALIDKPGREMSRDRVLTDAEIRRLWRLLSRQPTTEERAAPGRKRAVGTTEDPICPVAPPLAAAIKVRLLTAQRGGEVMRMRWRDVDLETGWWTIPAEYCKNGQAHRIPLVREAMAIIEAQQTERDQQGYVFVGSGTSVWDRAKKAPSRIARVLNVEFRGHDLRRTAATKMAEAGVPRHHISAVLNHIEGGPRATRVYDRYSYDTEKRVALETWARRLHSIVEQHDAGKVLPFGSAAAR